MPASHKEIQQTCKVCGSKLVPLFYTVECNRCDKPITGWFYRAYVLWTLEPDELWSIHEHPIFKWRSDCEIWKEKQYKPSGLEVRHVLSYDKFFWTELPGTLLEVAGVYHKVHTTHTNTVTDTLG
jgi:hypothetical protein